MLILTALGWKPAVHEVSAERGRFANIYPTYPKTILPIL